ncbi:MAG TPA: penicillin-binding protein 2 [Solirubrobacteraceae bacterium]
MADVQRRIGPLFAMFFLLLMLAAARTAYLGVFRAPSLQKAASAQQVTDETITAQRGTIADRNGVDLAVSEPARDLAADPYLLKNPLVSAEKLSSALGIPQATLLRKLSQRTGFVYLARAVPARQAEAALALKIPGVTGTPVSRRVYPRNSLAAQVLGAVGTEGQGLSGLEYSRETVLHGVAGERRVVSDAIGQPVSITEPRHEMPGKGLTLTLDANIQQRAEEVLKAIAQNFSPKDETAIVMDPRSGAILALANWPEVNANDPGGATPAALQNRAVGFPYEPGSTFKVVAVSGALQAGLITPDSGFSVPGEIHVADRTIHDDVAHGVETLSTSQILARSSNVGAIEIGKLQGATRFNEWVHRFGFGTRTGVDLPGEERGLTLALDHYSGSSMGNLPIGQGELVTPMQMASAYAAIANGGILRAPHIVSGIGGKPQPLPAGHRIISAGVAAQVRHMLEGVLGPEGTASQVSVPGYTLAGKTGTASKVDPLTHEYSKSKYVASFLGFAPANAPKLLTAIVVDEPQNGSIFGGTVAAPAFGQIMSFALPYLGISPE